MGTFLHIYMTLSNFLCSHACPCRIAVALSISGSLFLDDPQVWNKGGHQFKYLWMGVKMFVNWDGN